MTGKAPDTRPEGMGGCTVGMIRLNGGLLFFKNRDLGKRYQVNNITVFHSTPEFRTLKGVNLQTTDLEGVSIGVNRHKVCVANTHVVSSDDVAYDVLCEELVRKVRRKSDVRRVVRTFMKGNVVQGGRILVATPRWGFLVEVLRDRFEIQEIKSAFAMTNSFSLISHKKAKLRPPGGSSETRLRVAGETIPSISHVGALKAMLRSHVPEKGPLSICNHGANGGTESSHIIQIRGDYVGWSWLVGHPCENDYHAIELFQG